MSRGLFVALTLALLVGATAGFFLYPVIGLGVFLLVAPLGFLIGLTVPNMIDGRK